MTRLTKLKAALADLKQRRCYTCQTRPESGRWSMSSPLTDIERAVLPAVIGQPNAYQRVVLVYVCYLDDSGTHAPAEVVVTGGFVAPLAGWVSYEKQMNKLYRRNSVETFHAKRFKKGVAEFKNWPDAKRLGFAQCMIDAANGSGCVGVTVGLQKALFKDIKNRHAIFQSTSGYGMAFRCVIDRLSDDAEMGKAVREHGLSVVFEAGNTNDENLVREFNALQKVEGYEFLDSITAKKKRDSKALHLADFLAHFSWVYAECWPKYDRGEAPRPEMDAYLFMIKESIRTIGNYVEDIIPPWRRASASEPAS